MQKLLFASLVLHLIDKGELESNYNCIRSCKMEECEAYCMLLERQHTGEATASRNKKYLYYFENVKEQL